jgi:hypothetical protein
MVRSSSSIQTPQNFDLLMKSEIRNVVIQFGYMQSKLKFHYFKTGGLLLSYAVAARNLGVPSHLFQNAENQQSTYQNILSLGLLCEY